MKATRLQALSIRAKLKNANVVELVIMNHDTNEMQLEYIPIEIGTTISPKLLKNLRSREVKKLDSETDVSESESEDE